MRSYAYEHMVSFEETNALGNVYFSNFLKWQGICRERFLKEFAPELIDEFPDGLKIATMSCSCSYYWELYAFDHVVIEMYLDGSRAFDEMRDVNVLRLYFKYWRGKSDQRLLAAEGEQQIAFLYPQNPPAWERGPIPDALQVALIPFGLSNL
jgi:enediyne core biosynthesis thioesterase